MESNLPVVPVVTTGVLCSLFLLSVFFSRKCYFLLSSVLFFVYGAAFICFPLESLKSQMGEITGVTVDHWTVLTMQNLGVVSVGVSLLFFLFRNSNDERVGKQLMTLFAQLCLSEVILEGLLQMKVMKNVPVPGKDGKIKPATGLQIKNEVFYIWYAGLAVFIVTNLIHYLKSPSPKPQAPARYDAQMNVHRCIFSYVMGLLALAYLINPDMTLKILLGGALKAGRMDDLLRFNCQFSGVFMLAQVAFVRGSADFVNKEDQAAVFKYQVITGLISQGVLAYHIFHVGKIPIEAMLPGVIMSILLLLSGIVAIVRAGRMELDLKESKKRK